MKATKPDESRSEGRGPFTLSCKARGPAFGQQYAKGNVKKDKST